MVVTHEEYPSGDKEEDSPSEVVEVAAMAITKTTSPTSLFHAPNDNLHTVKDVCLMAKASEVSPITKPKCTPTIDLDSLKVKIEVVSLDEFLTNMQGETKRHVESLMAQLGEAQDLIKDKEGHEREAADQIASLAQALEEEQILKAVVEESMANLQESYNLNISTLIKERDHALALVKVLKMIRLSLTLVMQGYLRI